MVAVSSVAWLLGDSCVEAITIWWSSFHSTLRQIRFKGQGNDQVLPCWLRSLWVVVTFTRILVPTTSSLESASPVEAGFERLFGTPCCMMKYLFTWSGCWLDLTLRYVALPMLCGEYANSKAHTLGRRHLNLPSLGLMLLYLSRLPF